MVDSGFTTLIIGERSTRKRSSVSQLSRWVRWSFPSNLWMNGKRSEPKSWLFDLSQTRSLLIPSSPRLYRLQRASSGRGTKVSRQHGLPALPERQTSQVLVYSEWHRTTWPSGRIGRCLTSRAMDVATQSSACTVSAFHLIADSGSSSSLRVATL